MHDVPDKFVQKSELDLAIIAKALQDGKLSGTSELVVCYERKLVDFFGSRYAIAVSSGSAALAAA
jgi:perosamine synthetase